MKLTLKELRLSKKLTQAEASKAIGVSQGMWHKYETGKSYPTVPFVRNMEKLFQIKFDDIVFLKESRK